MASPDAPSGSACGRRCGAGCWAALCLVFLTGPLAADRARVRAVGIFLAVRAGHGHGGGADRSVAGEGPAVDGHRPAHNGGRHRSDRQRAALHVRLGVHRRRLSLPAGADRHLRFRADHDRHREDARSRPSRHVRRARAVRALLAPEGQLGDHPATLPAGLGHHRRPDHRHPAGDRRQRVERDGLRPGQEVLQDAREVRQRPSRRHHRLGGLQQRQRVGLADDHHGVRHPRRRGDGRHAGRHDHPRHPVRARCSSRRTPACPTASTRPTSWRIR